MSVSLYRRDIEKLDEIKEFMRRRGYRNLNDSEALRLVCRTAPLGDDLVHAYQEMQADDGRRKAI